MPSRRALAEISGNHAPPKQLSNESKMRLVGRMCGGQSASEIGQAEGVPKATVNQILRRYRQNNRVYNKPEDGGPVTYSRRDEVRIVRYARSNPTWIYSDLETETGVHLSRRELRLILEKHGISNSRGKRRSGPPKTTVRSDCGKAQHSA